MQELKVFHTLPADAARIREEVFMQEQGFTEEFDDIDATATHLVLYDGGQAVGTCRYFPGEAPGVWIIGRLAVRKPWRKAHGGTALLAAVEREARAQGVRELRLAAQVRAAGFYEKCGFVRQGEEFYEEFCPHVWMSKTLGA